MVLDATEKYDKPLTDERLFGWHAALFPTGRNGMHKITVGNWRTEAAGPMQVVSGPEGRQRVHYEAPVALKLDSKMKDFLAWFNGNAEGFDPVLKASIAHLWFVTVHPSKKGAQRQLHNISAAPSFVHRGEVISRALIPERLKVLLSRC
jgi:Fic family protein